LPFHQAKVTLGTSEATTLPLPDAESVGGQHAQLAWHPETAELYLHDLNSLYGTFLNGERMLRAAALRPGDRFRLGGENGPVFEVAQLGAPDSPAASPTAEAATAHSGAAAASSSGQEWIAKPSTTSGAPTANREQAANQAYDQLYQEEAQASQLSYASFGERFLAYLVDGVVLAMAGFVFQGFSLFGGMDTSEPNFTDGLGGLLGLLYFTLMESSKYQATLGKMALGIKVTDMEGRRISWGRALGRYLGKIVSALILLIGFIMAGFTEKRQALHDMMAKTLVVK
jgi:uncharacterized RDD family membrane protein YckC